MKEDAPSPGRPSIATAVTQVTLVPPVITVSGSIATTVGWAELQECQWSYQDAFTIGWASFVHSLGVWFLKENGMPSTVGGSMGTGTATYLWSLCTAADRQEMR